MSGFMYTEAARGFMASMGEKGKLAKTKKAKEALDTELTEAAMKLNVAELPPLVLWVAIGEHFFFLAKYLIDSGMDIATETQGVNPFWQTIYQYPNAAEIAAGEGADKDIVNWILTTLLGRGADINAPNADGQTPLQFAAEMELHPLMDFLMTNGADADGAKELALKGGLPFHSARKLIPISAIQLPTIQTFDIETRKGEPYNTQEEDIRYIIFYHGGVFTKYLRDDLRSKAAEQLVYTCKAPGSTKRSNVYLDRKMIEVMLFSEAVFIEANILDIALDSTYTMFVVSKFGDVTNVIRDEEIDADMNLNNSDAFYCQTGDYEVYGLTPIVYMPAAGGKRTRKRRLRRRSMRKNRNRA